MWHGSSNGGKAELALMKRVLVTAQMLDPKFESGSGRRAFESLGGLVAVEPYTQREMTAADADNVIGVIADSALFTKAFYEAANDLRIVTRRGVGFEKVNVEIATRLGVVICVAPVHMTTVAEYAVAQWLASLKRVYTLNRMSHAGEFDLLTTYEAQGSTLGLYGFGRIGQQVALRARPLLGESGRLLVYDVRPDIGELAAKFEAEAVDRPMRLFEECDTVSLHVSGDETIVTYEQLCAMRPRASLINPSRGNLVDDAAVNRAIEEERLFYYIVDDPTNGPREIHRGHPRIICTNHNAGITVESIERLDATTFDQVERVLRGERPPHILNEEVLAHPRVRGWLKR